MLRVIRFLVIALACVIAVPVLISADVIDPAVRVKSLQTGEAVQANAQLQLARQLMASQDFQSAADLLEVLFESDPGNSVVSNSLRSCYEQLKQYAKGELLLRRLSQQFPENFNYKMYLAENLVRQGKLEEGKQLYNNLVDNFQGENPVMFTNVVRSMIQCDLDEEALSVIEKLRLQSANPWLMAVERAGILEQKRNYADAALEYFGALRDSTGVGNAAEKSLEELLVFEESSIPAEKALLTKINADSSGRALKVLSAYYLKTGRFDDAYKFALRQDSASGFGGASLIQYLRGCMERKLYPQAIRISEYVFANCKNKPFVSEFYYRYAESLEELGNYQQAISVYDTIFNTFPREQDKAEAVYRIGRIHLERLDNPERSLVYFDSVINNYVLGFGYNGACLSKPRAYLQMGDIPRARTEFQKLKLSRYTPEVAEEIDFNLALLFLFEHKYDSCHLALKKLMVDYSQGFYINDAVQLSFVINQAGDAIDLLDNYAGAMQFQKMKLNDSTVSRLVSIADAENKALSDIALIRLVEIVLNRGDSTGAIKYVERMETEHPESYYLPYGLKAKADILVTKPDAFASAKEIYRRLLENYQNYPFINEVREKLRKLESGASPS